MPDEKQFCRNCENLAILRQQNELAGYTDAQRQLEGHNQKLLEDYANG